MLTNTLHSNLQFLRKREGLKQAEIPDRLGFVRNTWSNWENGISEPKIEAIIKIAQYFDINVGDLMTVDLAKGNLIDDSVSNQKGNLKGNPKGNLIAKFERKTPESEGEISPFLAGESRVPKVVTVDFAGNENIVHVPVKARAGYLLGYGDSHFIEGLEAYKLPGFRNGTFRSFEVEGNSMKPNIQPRDWVVGEWLESLSDIRENRVHIVVTKNDGVLIKRVLNRISERGKLYLKSDSITHRNEYPTIELDPSEVSEIWYSRIKFSSDFSEPAEIYTRMNNMELSLMELQRFVGLNRTQIINPE